eukprot:TRINITY_DN15618_c0_g1_i1.p1 TRINITY_DN15618_c0_g1~~TRINITY_DN15618_c0_g1_i1.p1  ORF type:complete len:186 (-),score=19.44 TRINITY_DN15618_c0_g1_i1:142-654(-)
MTTTLRCPQPFRCTAKPVPAVPHRIMSNRWSKETLDCTLVELQGIFQQAKPDLSSSSYKIDSPREKVNGSPKVSRFSLIHSDLIEVPHVEAIQRVYDGFTPPERSCNPVPLNPLFADWMINEEDDMFHFEGKRENSQSFYDFAYLEDDSGPFPLDLEDRPCRNYPKCFSI